MYKFVFSTKHYFNKNICNAVPLWHGFLSGLFQAHLAWVGRLFQAWLVAFPSPFGLSGEAFPSLAGGFSKPICKLCFSKHMGHALLVVLEVCLHCISKGFIPTTSPSMALLQSVDWIDVQSTPGTLWWLLHNHQRLPQPPSHRHDGICHHCQPSPCRSPWGWSAGGGQGHAPACPKDSSSSSSSHWEWFKAFP